MGACSHMGVTNEMFLVPIANFEAGDVIATALHDVMKHSVRTDAIPVSINNRDARTNHGNTGEAKE